MVDSETIKKLHRLMSQTFELLDRLKTIEDQTFDLLKRTREERDKLYDNLEGFFVLQHSLNTGDLKKYLECFQEKLEEIQPK